MLKMFKWSSSPPSRRVPSAAMPKSIVLTTLSVFLGLFFLLMGTLKVSTVINKELHRDVRRTFVHFAKVFPLASWLGFKVSPKYYRLVVGYSELIGGFVLLFVPSSRLKHWVTIGLMVVNMNSLLNYWLINDKFERKSLKVRGSHC